ncbi:A.superbus venom factor 1-like isoform X2 [Amblyomma americanum]
MASTLALVCALFVALCTPRMSAEENCFVVAPNVFRLGTNETFAVMVDGVKKRVTVTLQNYPSSRGAFFHWTGDVASDNLRIVDIAVKETDLPELFYGRDQIYVTLEVTCGRLWTRKTQVLVSPASGEHFFLQTEKPIYHPGSTVNIRFLAVDGKLEPSASSFRLEVRNPQNVIVERTDFQPSKELMLTHTYELPERTLLGEWALVVKYGYKFQQNTTATFLVDKYVLPRFKVDLSVPDYVLSNFSTIPCRVKASFVNKMPVHGVVLLEFGLRHEVGDIWWFSSSKSPKLLEGGEAHYILRREALEPNIGDKLPDLHATHGRLVVKATVTEEATGAKESAQSEKTVFCKTPFVVSLKKNQRSFKPGLKIYITAEVTYVNGNPAANVLTKATRLNSRDTFTARTRSDGVATFLIPVSFEDGTLSVKVETADSRYRPEHQARAQISLEPYSTVQSGFIAIERKDPKSFPRARDTYEAVLFTHRFDKVSSSIYYVVLSKGRIQLVDKLLEGRRIEQNIAFSVTPEMTPSFRVVVFAILDGRVVTDSIYVNAEPACTTTSQFTLERRNLGNPPEPMSQETLVLTGTRGTVVGLLGVDQAMYLLRKKDLLTRDKLFRSLDSKDLGCGAGGGTNAAEALYSSGIVLLTHEDVGNPMRSVEEYEDETVRKCCLRGQWPDRFLRSCSKRAGILRKYMEQGSANITQDCVEAFERCCDIAEHDAAQRSSSAGVDELSDEYLGVHNQIRDDFRETWIFHSMTIRDDGTAEFSATLPASVTTWEVNAVSVSPSGGVCAVEPLEIVATKKFFVEVNVPYSVVKKEQVEIPATVYNYGTKQITAKVVLLGTNDICSGAKLGKPSAVRVLEIPPGHGRTAIFPVVPLAAGKKQIHVKARSTSGEGDEVKVELNVRPPGVQRTRSFAVILDPENPKKRNTRNIQEEYTETFGTNGTQVVHIRSPRPDFALPNTERCEIDIVGDGVTAVLQSIIKKPDQAFIYPSDCGEQTTAKLMPVLYAYEFFKTANRISIAEENDALDYIRRAYNQILKYRKPDGSFSVFEWSSASPWLTAFVIRNLCEATKSVMIDENVIRSGLRYITSRQQGNGGFHEYSLSELVLNFGHPSALTAFILITFEECAEGGYSVSQTSRARAAAFLERNLHRGDSPGALALAAYALSLANNTGKDGLIQWLMESVRYDQVTDDRHVPASSELLSAQATAYALMALIRENAQSEIIRSFQRWLSKRTGPTGSVQSTQDTVMVLQALTKFAAYAKENNLDLACEVTLSNSKIFKKNIRIKRDNATILNKIEIDRPGEKIFVRVKGSGTGILYFNYTYDAKVLDGELCKFNITANFVETKPDIELILTRVSRSVEKTSSRPPSDLKPNYRMEACARPVEHAPDGMVMLEVGLLTGFKPNATELDELVKERKIQLYTITSRHVDFYVPFIAANMTHCVNFSLEQEFNAGKLQSSYVKAYSYYKPDFSCTRFYSPDKTSPLLKADKCDDSDVCVCAEGGCPPEKPLDRFIKIRDDEYFEDEEQRELLREFACDGVHYVWRGNSTANVSTDGFIEVAFLITQVLKPGQEDDLKGKIRRIKARDTCNTFNIPNGEEYIVMGKDSTYIEKDLFETKQFLYLIDSSSMVFPAKPKNKQQNRLAAWFINEFSDERTRCFL